jgi:hypothetical protein
MQPCWVTIAIGLAVWGGSVPAAAAVKAADVAGEPKLLSVYPSTGQQGATFSATLRGNSLREATAVFVDQSSMTASIDSAEAEISDKPAKGRFDLVRLHIEIAKNTKPGPYPLRLVTARGISNAVMIHIVEYPVAEEPAGPHETPDTAVVVKKFPVVFNGRIAQRGESDYYSFDALAGQTLTFEAISGLPSIGAAGGNAAGFDPSLTLYEPSGSWFDPKRLNRIGFNDEPLWVLGQLTDAYLVHRFEKAGRYFVRIEAFSGQGGPDYNYQLKIIPGEAPQDRAPATGNWEERGFARHLSANRLNELAERGGKVQTEKAIESYRAVAIAQSPAPLFAIPGTIEGGLTKPGEAHRARFHLDGPQDIAVEIETPASGPPLFNPIVRLLNTAGEEIATNIFVGRGACNGEMNKSIQAKTILPLRDSGDYTVEIRDTTSDLADAGFRYRVQVRPQIPHVGQVRIDEDRVNIAPGEAKTVRVTFDREEGYSGAVAVIAEGLPAGVQALAGADFEPDKDPPRFANKRERYAPRTERIVVVLTASPDAPVMKQPQIARLVVRPINGGKAGVILQTKQLPMMVVAKP